VIQGCVCRVLAVEPRAATWCSPTAATTGSGWRRSAPARSTARRWRPETSTRSRAPARGASPVTAAPAPARKSPKRPMWHRTARATCWSATPATAGSAGW